MKKLLQNIKHLIVLLLLTISLNAFAAQHKEIKHNIQANNQIDYQSIDYSKLNYRQLNNLLFTITTDDNKVCANFSMAAYTGTMTQTHYKKASQLFLDCLKQVVPLEKEVINRLKKYSNNKEVYDMYQGLKYAIDNFVQIQQFAMDTATNKFKQHNLEENY